MHIHTSGGSGSGGIPFSLLLLPPPPSLPWQSHAIDCSIKFLLAAGTALKIAQVATQQHNCQQQQQEQQQQLSNVNNNYNDNKGSATLVLPEWLLDINPMDLKLYQHYSLCNHSTTITMIIMTMRAPH
jgi:hypothetical protein